MSKHNAPLILPQQESKLIGSPGPPYELRPFGSPDMPKPWFPWLTYVPLELRKWLAWTPVPVSGSPKLLLLYTGPEDEGSMDHVLNDLCAMPTSKILALDLCRDPSHDLLQPCLYHELCTWADQGKLLGVIGGPMCRTWSIRRHIFKPGFPRPVRGRDGLKTWGLKDLSQSEKVMVEGDSILLIRQLYISSLVFRSEGPVPMFLLEHPADPAWASDHPAGYYCSSIWATKAVQQ